MIVQDGGNDWGDNGGGYIKYSDNNFDCGQDDDGDFAFNIDCESEIYGESLDGRDCH